MNQQPDKFFREKLEGYQKAAPASAWDKIAAAQAKKNNKGLWLKIAASLLLLAISAYLLWTKDELTGEKPSALTTVGAEKNPTPQPKNNKKVGPPQETNVAPAQQPSPAATEKSSPKKDAIHRIKTRSSADTQAKETHAVENITAIPKDQLVSQSKDEQEELSPVLPESNESSVASNPSELNTEKPKHIKLVFTAKETDEYLDKKSLAQATSDDKKPSTLKKLLQKANDLKNNQDPFGDLRQKKNEILALNFKNEKRGQNK